MAIPMQPPVFHWIYFCHQTTFVCNQIPRQVNGAEQALTFWCVARSSVADAGCSRCCIALLRHNLEALAVTSHRRLT
jgi:hypothetical protein